MLGSQRDAVPTPFDSTRQPLPFCTPEECILLAQSWNQVCPGQRNELLHAVGLTYTFLLGFLKPSLGEAHPFPSLSFLCTSLSAPVFFRIPVACL